jgi:hypothetical protein
VGVAVGTSVIRASAGVYNGRLEIPALTARDANADPMLDLFAAPSIDPAELAYCEATFGN